MIELYFKMKLIGMFIGLGIMALCILYLAGVIAYANIKDYIKKKTNKKGGSK